jgi:KDO2-lipid IV(A) lauroyltransferase
MARALMRLAARLPLAWLHAAGALLGWAIYAASPTYRRQLNENLARAGYRDARTRRAAIAAAGKMIAELPAIWFRPHLESAKLVRSVEDESEVLDAHRGGEPLLFLTPHLGCFEVTPLYAATLMPITVLYRPPRIAALEPLLRAGRERPNVRLAAADLTGVRELRAALKRGEAAGILPDQVPATGEGEWAEFFGAPAYTMTLAARLAERPGLRCYLAYARRLPRGAGYAIAVRRYPEKRPGETPVRRLNRALEELIRECPEQYLWGYNRYKTPRGAKPREKSE